MCIRDRSNKWQNIDFHNKCWQSKGRRRSWAWKVDKKAKTWRLYGRVTSRITYEMIVRDRKCKSKNIIGCSKPIMIYCYIMNMDKIPKNYSLLVLLYTYSTYDSQMFNLQNLSFRAWFIICKLPMLYLYRLYIKPNHHPNICDF